MNQPPPAADRLVILSGSVQCLVRGVCALIPLLGLAPLFGAFGMRKRVQVAGGDRWNPAERHLRWGVRLAWIAVFYQLAIFLLVVLRIGQSMDLI